MLYHSQLYMFFSSYIYGEFIADFMCKFICRLFYIFIEGFMDPLKPSSDDILYSAVYICYLNI